MNIKELLEEEPITPETLDAALLYLVRLGVVDIPKKGKIPKGRDWFARELGVSSYTVQAWISGRNKLKGFSAQAVRQFFARYIK
jgi:hypothetical protein